MKTGTQIFIELLYGVVVVPRNKYIVYVDQNIEILTIRT